MPCRFGAPAEVLRHPLAARAVLFGSQSRQHYVKNCHEIAGSDSYIREIADQMRPSNWTLSCTLPAGANGDYAGNRS